MKQLFSLIFGAAILVSVVAFGVSFEQAKKEQTAQATDLKHRTELLADSLVESMEPVYLSNSPGALQKLIDKFTNRERLEGLVVYDDKANAVAESADLSQQAAKQSGLAQRAISGNFPADNFSDVQKSGMYFYAEPLHNGEAAVGALMVVQKADYINTSLKQVWQNNWLRLLLQTLLYSLAAWVIVRWLIIRPLVKLVASAKMARAGSPDDAAEPVKSHVFFGPLAKEISSMSKSLFLARSSASLEARLRLEKLDSPWTAERLKEFIKAYLKDRQIIVVSNREPYIHAKIKNQISVTVPASGMVTAIEPIMEACGGLWLAHGSGSADVESSDKNGKIAVPPDEPKYTLKRVWLTEQEIKGHYIGFSNEALWPLCHLAHTRPIFRAEDWLMYRKVNGKFAQALLAEIKDLPRPVILVQDFHFALLPEMIKKSRPDAEVGLFWHIPWPSAESFSICPWRREILEGMLGADVVGFHTQAFCNNFLETVGKDIESVTDLEKFAITKKGHTAYIKSFPISVPFTGTETQADAKPKLPENLGKHIKFLGLGVDRMDYTKGILERLRGVEYFFESYPAYKGQFTFLQIAPPSREEVEKYREFGQQVIAEVQRINKKLGASDWQPVVLLNRHHTHEEIYPLYRAANVCLVTSLSDGMNLVAKEFVAARDDEAGVLVLSQFTGAARDLSEALIVNPYSAEQTAEAIFKAITMPAAEQHRRMKKMRQTVKNYNVYRWAAEFIKSVADI